MSRKLKDQLAEARSEVSFWFTIALVLGTLFLFNLLNQQNTTNRQVETSPRNPTPSPTISPDFLSRSNLTRYCGLDTTQRGDPYCVNGKPNERVVIE